LTAIHADDQLLHVTQLIRTVLESPTRCASDERGMGWLIEVRMGAERNDSQQQSDAEHHKTRALPAQATLILVAAIIPGIH